jgi:transcriptional regulator with XRE-family HTH domain
VLLIRLGRGVDQRDLAIRSGVSTGQLSKIENATYPTWRNAADRIARGLDFPSALLLLYAFYGQDLPATEEALGLEEPEG